MAEQVGAMAEVELREIDRESWEECMQLVLRLEQGGLVAPHRYQGGNFAAEPSFVQLGVYHGDEMVGYGMYGQDPDDGHWWIYRLMIDLDHQGRGFGKAALEAMVERMKQDHGITEVYMGYRPENHIAAALAWTAGFERTGQMLQGEYIVRRDLNGAGE